MSHHQENEGHELRTTQVNWKLLICELSTLNPNWSLYSECSITILGFRAIINVIIIIVLKQC